ncbi:MAG: SH3 domain-containing protein [Tepidisphaerales bacterium]
MAARLSLLTAVFSASILGTLFATGVSAQVAPPSAQPEVENSRYQFLGATNAPSVQVRSGPGENYYATAKVDKGTPVTVVGVKFDWLKIVPPEGSFSVVAKAFVNREGNAGTGKVTADTLNVRAGSNLVPMKVTVQCKLQKGAEVQIIGEQDEYYMIKPPAEAYLYVHQKFVDPVKQINEKPIASATGANGPTTRPIFASDTTQPPTTRPATVDIKPPEPQVDHVAIAMAEYERFELDAKAADARPLGERPYPELIETCKKLIQNEYLPGQNKIQADVRLQILVIKNRNREQWLATQKDMAEATVKLAKTQQERAAAQDKVDAGITTFTALGLLQASAVQPGDNQTLYRITDPATGRSLCYVRTNDPKFASFIDKFVGVKGELITDAQLSLKTVSATDIQAVDQAKVNHGVTAQIVPPSMVGDGAGSTATTGN